MGFKLLFFVDSGENQDLELEMMRVTLTVQKLYTSMRNRSQRSIQGYAASTIKDLIFFVVSRLGEAAKSECSPMELISLIKVVHLLSFFFYNECVDIPQFKAIVNGYFRLIYKLSGVSFAAVINRGEITSAELTNLIIFFKKYTNKESTRRLILQMVILKDITQKIIEYREEQIDTYILQVERLSRCFNGLIGNKVIRAANDLAAALRSNNNKQEHEDSQVESESRSNSYQLNQKNKRKRKKRTALFVCQPRIKREHFDRSYSRYREKRFQKGGPNFDFTIDQLNSSHKVLITPRGTQARSASSVRQSRSRYIDIAHLKNTYGKNIGDDTKTATYSSLKKKLISKAENKLRDTVMLDLRMPETQEEKPKELNFDEIKGLVRNLRYNPTDTDIPYSDLTDYLKMKNIKYDWFNIKYGVERGQRMGINSGRPKVSTIKIDRTVKEAENALNRRPCSSTIALKKYTKNKKRILSESPPKLTKSVSHKIVLPINIEDPSPKAYMRLKTTFEPRSQRNILNGGEKPSFPLMSRMDSLLTARYPINTPRNAVFRNGIRKSMIIRRLGFNPQNSVDEAKEEIEESANDLINISLGEEDKEEDSSIKEKQKNDALRLGFSDTEEAISELISSVPPKIQHNNAQIQPNRLFTLVDLIIINNRNTMLQSAFKVLSGNSIRKRKRSFDQKKSSISPFQFQSMNTTRIRPRVLVLDNSVKTSSSQVSLELHMKFEAFFQSYSKNLSFSVFTHDMKRLYSIVVILEMQSQDRMMKSYSVIARYVVVNSDMWAEINLPIHKISNSTIENFIIEKDLLELINTSIEYEMYGKKGAKLSFSDTSNIIDNVQIKGMDTLLEVFLLNLKRLFCLRFFIEKSNIGVRIRRVHASVSTMIGIYGYINQNLLQKKLKLLRDHPKLPKPSFNFLKKLGLVNYINKQEKSRIESKSLISSSSVSQNSEILGFLKPQEDNINANKEYEQDSDSSSSFNIESSTENPLDFEISRVQRINVKQYQPSVITNRVRTLKTHYFTVIGKQTQGYWMAQLLIIPDEEIEHYDTSQTSLKELLENVRINVHLSNHCIGRSKEYDSFSFSLKQLKECFTPIVNSREFLQIIGKRMLNYLSLSNDVQSIRNAIQSILRAQLSLLKKDTIEGGPNRAASFKRSFVERKQDTSLEIISPLLKTSKMVNKLLSSSRKAKNKVKGLTLGLNLRRTESDKQQTPNVNITINPSFHGTSKLLKSFINHASEEDNENEVSIMDEECSRRRQKDQAKLRYIRIEASTQILSYRLYYEVKGDIEYAEVEIYDSVGLRSNRLRMFDYELVRKFLIIINSNDDKRCLTLLKLFLSNQRIHRVGSKIIKKSKVQMNHERKRYSSDRGSLYLDIAFNTKNIYLEMMLSKIYLQFSTKIYSQQFFFVEVEAYHDLDRLYETKNIYFRARLSGRNKRYRVYYLIFNHNDVIQQTKIDTRETFSSKVNLTRAISLFISKFSLENGRTYPQLQIMKQEFCTPLSPQTLYQSLIKNSLYNLIIGADKSCFMDEIIQILKPMFKFVIMIERSYGIITFYDLRYMDSIVLKIYLPKTKRKITMMINTSEMPKNQNILQTIIKEKINKLKTLRMSEREIRRTPSIEEISTNKFRVERSRERRRNRIPTENVDHPVDYSGFMIQTYEYLDELLEIGEHQLSNTLNGSVNRLLPPHRPTPDIDGKSSVETSRQKQIREFNNMLYWEVFLSKLSYERRPLGKSVLRVGDLKCIVREEILILEFVIKSEYYLFQIFIEKEKSNNTIFKEFGSFPYYRLSELFFFLKLRMFTCEREQNNKINLQRVLQLLDIEVDQSTYFINLQRLREIAARLTRKVYSGLEEHANKGTLKKTLFEKGLPYLIKPEDSVYLKMHSRICFEHDLREGNNYILLSKSILNYHLRLLAWILYDTKTSGILIILYNSRSSSTIKIDLLKSTILKFLPFFEIAMLNYDYKNIGERVFSTFKNMMLIKASAEWSV